MEEETEGVLIEDLQETSTAGEENFVVIETSDSTKKIKISALFSSLKSWINLAKVAFSGSYNDLQDKPTPVNDLLQSTSGKFLDAMQGNVLDKKIGNLNELQTENKNSIIDAINEQNTNLTKKTITDLTESVTSGYTIRAMRSGNILQVVVNIPSGANGWITAGKIAQKYAPFDLTPMAVRVSSANDNNKMQGFYILSNGEIGGYITSALTTDAFATATYII